MWYPIAAAHDLPFRHVYHAKLLGEELAVWRADDGFVNVWQNRCLHRGVRLSIGINDGQELKCQYHGWRYASRTAGCTYIPAQPDKAPARTITNRIYPVAERYGLVWSALAPPSGEPGGPIQHAGEPLVLRGVAVHAAAEPVSALLEAHGPVADGSVVFVQPVDGESCVIRGLVFPAPEPGRRLAILRDANEQLSAVRDRAERQPPPAP